MLRHRKIDRICCMILALTVLSAGLFIHGAAAGFITADTGMGYESRLFDQGRVHTIDIVMEDWETFLETATSEEYAPCTLVIDGESYRNAAIRGKGNTSLSTVRSYGNNRYSFKVEFDHYQAGSTYHGLDKLSLNNLIQDNSYMKDYFAYTLMGRMGVAAPLCSFVQINVNGQPWGLYLAVEGVEDGFLQRNYGKNYGELYKPDSMSFGGGRGNGRDFNMDDVAEKFGFSFDRNEQSTEENKSPAGNRENNAVSVPMNPFGGNAPAMPFGGNAPAMPFGGGMPDMGGDFQNPFGGGMPGMGGNAPAMPSGENPFGGGAFKTPSSGRGAFGMGSNDVKLIYTDDNPESYQNIFGNAKTDISPADQSRLIGALKAMNGGDTAAVDTDAVIRYMAVHNFLCNDDSYTGTMIHNYYLYEENGVLSMIPWDYNLGFGTFGGGGNASGSVNRSIDSLVNGGGGDRPMADWITESEIYTAQYRSVYQEFMDTLFDSGWFAQEIDRVIAMIDPYVQKEENAFCTYDQFKTGAETLKKFCLARAESVKMQLRGEKANADASGINISAMGSMGGMGGMNRDGGMGNRENNMKGNFNRSFRNNASAPQSSADIPSPNPWAAPEQNNAPSDAGAESQNAPAQQSRPQWGALAGMPSAARQQTDHQGLIWLASLGVVLMLALLGAWKYPGRG